MALAMVLIMVVVLSLTLSALAFLTQSTSTAVTQNLTGAERRSALVSEALAMFLQDINDTGSGKNDGSSSRQLGINETGYKCPSSKTYTISSVSPSETVTVSCKERSASGKVMSLASLVVTGTGLEEDGTTATCGSGGLADCKVGVDGGVYINFAGANSCTDALQSRLGFKAGIINVSGAWGTAVDCNSLSIPSGFGVEQPYQDSDCPATARVFKDGSTQVGCVCPGLKRNDADPYSGASGSWFRAAGFMTFDACKTALNGKKFSDLDAFSPGTNLNGFIRSTLSSVASPSALSQPSTDGTCAASLSPGIVTPATIAKLEDGTGCANSGDRTLTLGAGAYRFKDVQWDLEAKNWRYVKGGNVQTDGTCTPNQPGVQLQFEGNSSINMKKTLVILCPPDIAGSQPSVVAPAPGLGASFVSTATNVFTSPGGASGCSLYGGICGLISYGYILSPGSAADLYVAGNFKIVFAKGSLFKAVKISGNSSITEPNEVLPPPPFTGDRAIQLKFEGSISQKLGTVDLVIRDFFGRRRAMGYVIKAWRTTW